MATKYGQRPSQICFGEGELSLMEEQMFDLAVTFEGLEEERRQMKAQQK